MVVKGPVSVSPEQVIFDTFKYLRKRERKMGAVFGVEEKSALQLGFFSPSVEGLFDPFLRRLV